MTFGELAWQELKFCREQGERKGILFTECGSRILTDERHESFIISRFTELLHQRLGLLLGQLLSEVGKKTEQLVGKHGVVVIFVVELQDLNEVMETSLVLGVFAGLQLKVILYCQKFGDVTLI